MRTKIGLVISTLDTPILNEVGHRKKVFTR